ncbi:hypothetical protein BB560_002553 [Smittium megazygosporum]|uniref:Syntaxin N-terminal domain-containing protein n=1 Tax=Smittium megazygosporum TaxID=133381 RepID=A0A2T9ZEF2_9FUNG|nr:hypothetical protein BB560_002553 [Smittium megazygosporum]
MSRDRYKEFMEARNKNMTETFNPYDGKTGIKPTEDFMKIFYKKSAKIDDELKQIQENINETKILTAKCLKYFGSYKSKENTKLRNLHTLTTNQIKVIRGLILELKEFSDSTIVKIEDKPVKQYRYITLVKKFSDCIIKDRGIKREYQMKSKSLMFSTLRKAIPKLSELEINDLIEHEGYDYLPNINIGEEKNKNLNTTLENIEKTKENMKELEAYIKELSQIFIEIQNLILKSHDNTDNQSKTKLTIDEGKVQTDQTDKFTDEKSYKKPRVTIPSDETPDFDASEAPIALPFGIVVFSGFSMNLERLLR